MRFDWAAGVLCAIVLTVPAGAGVWVEVESGAAFSGYNDVRIPPDTGTGFSLSEDLEADPVAFVRLRVGLRLGKEHRHGLHLLAAPLRIESRGRFAEAVHYRGVDFAPDRPTRAEYRFDSYRLVYRYRLVRGKGADFELGAAAKIRDAEIRLEQDGRTARKTDTGFVPLLAFALRVHLGARLDAVLEGEALASPGGQGRAEDILAALHWHPSSAVGIQLGYRLLEGGADVEEVYNFTLVHYLTAAVRLNLDGAKP